MKWTVKSLLGFIFWLGLVQIAAAQLYQTQYRPPHQHWQELTTPHFQIVFPAGNKYVAYKTAHILEQQYRSIQQLTGGGLTDFPIILNGYNDRSNGLVTTLHFRSEIAISPIKGKAMNPQTGGWLKNVVSHELVHAMQFSNLGTFGLGRIINIFSPDLARSLYGAIPAGLTEGLAVYHETHGVTTNGGRGNYPWFINQFKSTFTHDARWSLGQMVHFPVYSRPLNRYYIGGFAFNQWLLQTYGHNTLKNANDFYIQLPFLGYGVALLSATGQWPWQLYDEFEAYQQEKLSHISISSQPQHTLPIPYHGAVVRRPKWLNGHTLIFYASFYNQRPGFYRYDLKTKSMKRMITTGSVGDYHYTLSVDKRTLVYSFYQPDPIYDKNSHAELIKLNLKNGKSRQITDDGRIWAPTFVNDSTLMAIQTTHSWSQLVALQMDDSTAVDTVVSLPPFRIISIADRPMAADSLAVIINKNGVQGLWLASRTHLKQNLKKPPTVAFKNGSIFDIDWHPGGNRLLFTADFSGTMQIYEYNLHTDKITQLTNVPFNAFEASYSPDGDRIVFITQKTNQKLPVVLTRDEFYGKVLPTTKGHSAPSNFKKAKKWAAIDSSQWEVTKYSTGAGWLKPRTLLPIVEEVESSDSYKIGLGLHSSSLLQQQAYSFRFSYFEHRLWYDLTYRNTQFFPGFKVRLFSDPSLTTLRFKPNNEPAFVQKYILQERSLALSVPIDITLNQNVFLTSLYIEPEIRRSQLRFYDLTGQPQSNFSDATIGELYAQLNVHLQQNIRDVQPNTGFILYGDLEHHFSATNIKLQTQQGEVKSNFGTPTALQGGVISYVSFFPRWNQSLRIGVEAVTQNSYLFDNQDIVSDAFAGPVFPTAHNLVSVSTRYTIPLFYPDDGFLIIPLYLSNVYITAFTNTVVDPTRSHILDASRSVFGAELRFQFRISNLSFDIGVGIGYEPTRNQTEFIFSAF